MKPNLNTVDKLGFFSPRWLPVTGSVPLMVIICVVLAVSFSELKTENSWHEHSYHVLATAQTFLSDLFRIQADARNSVFSGQSAALKTFQDSANRAPQQVTQIKLLTRDNAVPQVFLLPDLRAQILEG